jgi:RNA polymerase-binding transcription factor
MNMKQKNIDTLKREMEAELERIVKEARDEMSPKLKVSYEDVADASGQAVADTFVDTENALIGIHLEKARDLNAALDRIQTGIYGVCIDCGEEIGLKRLTAYPTAKRCIDCQNQHTKKYASEPTPTL